MRSAYFNNVCNKPLFDPALLGIEAMSLDELVVRQVLVQSRDLRSALLQRIAVSGKAAACDNLVPRLSWVRYSMRSPPLLAQTDVRIAGNQFEVA